MRRSIIILVILLFAGSAYAQFPVDFECVSDPLRPKEAEFCRIFKVRLAASGDVVYEFNPERSYFMIIVLPTVRDGYFGITVASNFIYPPLAGLALSAYLSSYVITPDQADELDRCAEFMVGKNIQGISEWLVWFEGKIGHSRSDQSLEVRK